MKNAQYQYLHCYNKVAKRPVVMIRPCVRVYRVRNVVFRSGTNVICLSSRIFLKRLYIYIYYLRSRTHIRDLSLSSSSSSSVDQLSPRSSSSRTVVKLIVAGGFHGKTGSIIPLLIFDRHIFCCCLFYAGDDSNVLTFDDDDDNNNIQPKR